MRRLSPLQWILLIGGLICVCVGTLAIYPMIPLAWYPKLYPMPTVEEVLVNPLPRPAAFTSIDDLGHALCVTTSWRSMVNGLYLIGDFQSYTETVTEAHYLEETFNRTRRFRIDGREIPALATASWGGATSINIESMLCADVAELAPGRYVAQFSFETPPGDTYSYTWVFERTADGVIPEVRN